MIRVLLVDDQELVRSGFHIILESEPDIEVVGEASNGEEAIALAVEHAPDVICMDVEMPVMNGIDASRQILRTHPSTSVLILTTFGHEEYLFDALAAGVSGFLLKTSRAEQLIDAIHTLASGQALLGADVTRAVIQRVSATGPTSTSESSGASLTQATQAQSAAACAPGSSASSMDKGSTNAPDNSDASSALSRAITDAGLTEREREVLARLAEGKSNAEIAQELFLGEATIKTHVSNVLQKLGVRDRIQAVVWAHTQGSEE